MAGKLGRSQDQAIRVAEGDTSLAGSLNLGVGLSSLSSGPVLDCNAACSSALGGGRYCGLAVGRPRLAFIALYRFFAAAIFCRQKCTSICVWIDQVDKI